MKKEFWYKKHYIKENRIKKGLSRRELGKILGVTKGAVINWENYRNAIDPKNIKKMLELFQVEKKDLFEI